MGVAYCPLPQLQGRPTDDAVRGTSRGTQTERLWKEFFQDPSQWQDNRASKKKLTSLDLKNKVPDFKHKERKECLWLDGWDNPAWVRVHMRRLKREKENRGNTQDEEDASGDWSQKLTLKAVLNTLEAGLSLQVSIDDLICIMSRCRKELDASCSLRLLAFLHEWGLDAHGSLGNFLVPMLTEVECMPEARKVFDKLEFQNEYSWTCLITGYTKSREPEHALEVFENMQKDGSIQPNGYTYVAILKACSDLKNMKKGSEIHNKMATTGVLETDIFVGNALVDMYAKNGCLAQAQDVFDMLPVRDVVTWNVLAAGYSQDGLNQAALDCLEQMQVQGINPDAISYLCIFKVCGNLVAADVGKKAHSETIRKGLSDHDPVLVSALVDMYAKCGLLAEAQEVFDRLPVKDVVSWTALMAGYADHKQEEKALRCFEQMQAQGISPNAITYVCSLKACAGIGAVDKGQEIHAKVDKEGLLGWHVLLGSTLVVMYAKCGLLTKALQVFDNLPVRDVISWTALITGYVDQGSDEDALNCFDQMQAQGLYPDIVLFTCILRACGGLGAIDRGRDIHAWIEKVGLTVKDQLIGNALVDLYAKCGLLLDAQYVFDKLSARNVVAWTSLLAGFAQDGQTKMALQTFDTMVMTEGVEPNLISFVTIINACCHAGLIEKGEEYFEVMSKGYGIIPTIQLYTSMVDLFGRAGQLYKAVRLIKEMPHHADPAVWHIVLGACHKWGNVDLGRYTFEILKLLNEHDHIAFVCMANIYAEAGMHEEAGKIQAMSSQRRAQKQVLCSGEAMIA